MLQNEFTLTVIVGEWLKTLKNLLLVRGLRSPERTEHRSAERSPNSPNRPNCLTRQIRFFSRFSPDSPDSVSSINSSFKSAPSLRLICFAFCSSCSCINSRQVVAGPSPHLRGPTKTWMADLLLETSLLQTSQSSHNRAFFVISSSCNRDCNFALTSWFDWFDCFAWFDQFDQFD